MALQARYGSLGYRPAPSPPSPRPTVHLNGTEKLAKIVSQGFFEEMSSILARLGVAGTLICNVQTRVKGSSFTKGLRIKMPNRHGGITLTWHEGSNDDCIQMSLRVPGGQDLFEFRRRMLTAYQQLEEERLRRKRETEKPEQAVNGSHAAAAAPPQSGKPIEVQKKPEPEPAEVPTTQPSRNTQLFRFVDDTDKLGLFMLELKPLLDKDGTIQRATCSGILKKTFGVGRTGPVMRSLENCGHWKQVAAGAAFMLSEGWLKYLGVSVSVAVSEPQVVPAPTPAPEVPPPDAIVVETTMVSVPARRGVRTLGDIYRRQQTIIEAGADDSEHNAGPKLPVEASVELQEPRNLSLRQVAAAGVSPVVRKKAAKDKKSKELDDEIRLLQASIAADAERLEKLKKRKERRTKK